MNIAPVLVIFGTVRMCPGDKIGIEIPLKLKGKNEKRAPSAPVATGSVGCPNRFWVIHKHFKNVQKINLGEETQEISQKVPFEKHVSSLR